MARLYSNENFPYPTVEELRRLGHDVLTVLETGRANQAVDDADILAFAIEEGRSLLTLNRKHFMRLHTQTPDHLGIIVCKYDPDFVRLAGRIHVAITTEIELSNRLIRVNRPSR